MSDAELPVEVTGVRTGPGFVLELTFADGASGSFDVGPYLWGPVFEVVRSDPQVFATARVDPEIGTVVWPGAAGGEGVDLAPEFLYDHAVFGELYDHDPRADPAECVFHAQRDLAIAAMPGATVEAWRRHQMLQHADAALAELKAQTGEARAWAWAQWHRAYDKKLTDWEHPPAWLEDDVPAAPRAAIKAWAPPRPSYEQRRLVVDWAAYSNPGPGAVVVAHRAAYTESTPGVDTTLYAGDRVLLSSGTHPPTPAVVATDTTGADVPVVVLAHPVPEVSTSLQSLDDTGMPWVFVDETAHPRDIVPGRVVRVGDGPRVRAWAQVVVPATVVTASLVHLGLLPVVVSDDSLPPHPQGATVWSTDPGNDSIQHPLKVGDLVAERDMGDPPGTELPSRVTWVQSDPDRFGGWVYRVLPLIPPT
ncbi:DUF2442 domain-containing protein [Nostocoides sp. HKS02]|uniref:DUF2442 domain-containing protein n=1 Tax=Nostocoides sp. HKS02 TaxID=1813880 RepID=UPI001E489728|nr:DUF2442 domain-containing protein [Tetrasphaera sp. HKS02]